jgi:WD40 repeat protein
MLIVLKNPISAFFAFLLVLGCSTENPQPKQPTPKATPPVVVAKVQDGNIQASVPNSVQATQAEDIDTVEAAAIRPVSSLVSRVGTELRIRLLNGQTAILKDDTTAGMKFAIPRYAGYLTAIRSHVVHQYQYEGEGIYFVVDDSTGDSTMVFGMPVVSPDGKRFAFTSMEGLEGGNPGLIEIWRMVGRKPEKEFSWNTANEQWAASDAVWRDSATIDFFKNTYTSPADPGVHTIGRLTRTGVTWVLSESPH